MTDQLTPTNMRILFIDDSPDDARLLQYACDEGGLNADYKLVDSANALREVLQEGWNAIVSDFRMPGFGAASALQMIRECDAHVPVIVVSHDIDKSESARLINLGAAEVLEKSTSTILPLAIKRHAKLERQSRP